MTAAVDSRRQQGSSEVYIVAAASPVARVRRLGRAGQGTLLGVVCGVELAGVPLARAPIAPARPGPRRPRTRSPTGGLRLDSSMACPEPGQVSQVSPDRRSVGHSSPRQVAVGFHPYPTVSHWSEAGGLLAPNGAECQYCARQ